MSDIVIEGKNLKDIDQSNFQSVGPYTNPNGTQVKEQWQGRYKLSGSEDTDLRFDLGTYTENNRDHWEIQTVNSFTRRSQFQSQDLKTARASVKNNLVISDEVNWSVDTFPFVINENNETIPLYFYYDKDLHPTEYNNAVNGKVSLRIELRDSGRNTDGIIDNFSERDPYRPFFIGLNKNSYGTDADGLLIGGGAFNFQDRVRIEAIPNDDSNFIRWGDGESDQTVSTDAIYSFLMPKSDLELIGYFRLNPVIRMTNTINGSESEEAGRVWFGRSQEYPIIEEQLTNTFANAIRINNFYGDGQNPPDEGTSDLSTGTTRGHDGVFILLESEFDAQGSDDGYSVYTYTWGPNIQNLDAYSELEDITLNISDTIYESNTYRPDEIIKLYSEPSGQQFSFINYTYLDSNGDQQIIEITAESSLAEIQLGGEYTVGELATSINYTGPKGAHTVLSRLDYPGGVLEIYANYAVAFYRVRSYNRWKNSNEQNLEYRLRYGYGTVTLNEQEVSTTLEYMLGENLIVSAEPAQNGYGLGEFFFWPGAGATIEFDEDIANTIVGDDSRFLVSEQFTPDSDQIQQIIFNEDDITYIGHKFKQEGVYVKVSKAEDSADFSINLSDLSYDTPEIIRQASNSEEVGVDMWEVNGGDISWLISYNSSNSGQPVIQSVTYWNDADEGSGNLITSHPNSLPSGLDVELIPLSNNNQLNYTTPNSIDSDNYYKYIDIKLFSEILSPFRTVEINIVPPNTYLTNWDQEAVDSDADINLFTDDSLIENDPSSNDNQDSTIVVPEEFFNGTRELKIKVQSNSNFDVENPIVSISQISGPTQPNVGFSIDEVDDRTYIVSITNADRSFEISLDWDEGGV